MSAPLMTVKMDTAELLAVPIYLIADLMTVIMTEFTTVEWTESIAAGFVIDEHGDRVVDYGGGGILNQ